MRSYGTEVRTGKDRLQDALLFVTMARDHVIRTHTAESIATMKGVTVRKDVAEIGKLLSVRMAML